MNAFSIFTRLYMTAFLLEMLEKWKDPGFAIASLILVTLFVFNRVTRLSFFVFLVSSTAYFLVVKFPDVANHVNLLIYLNLALIAGVLYSWLPRTRLQTDDDYYAMMRPLLRVSIIAVYFWAGFHKLNTDFLKPEASCSSMMLYRIWDLLQTDLLGLPVMLVVSIALVFLIWAGLKRLLRWQMRSRSTVLLLICGGFVLYGLVFAYNELPLIPEPILMANIVMILAWELIGSVLLLIPRFQAPILLFSWIMHAWIAMIGFVDFSALAYALLFTFLPDKYLKLWQEQALIPIGKWKLHRMHLYFVLNTSIGLFSALFYVAFLDFEIKGVAGAIFNIAAFTFMWPILVILGKPRPAWQGASVLTADMPKFMFVFLICLCCFALTPYLGLRTAGTFSMFSNLRTEGPRSNHLLLGNNPIKFWHYQEDVVQFLEVPEDVIDLDAKNLDLQGKQLPVVEFRKMIYDWTHAGEKIPLAFEYRGTTYTTRNVVTDPVWKTDRRTWEMFLMDFRVIQSAESEPNLCRW